MDKKIKQLEALAEQIQNEKNFDVAHAKFNEAAKIVKELLSESSEQKGKTMEIIKDVDGHIERELKLNEEE